MLRTVRGLVAVLTLVVPSVLVAAAEQPKPVDLIFNSRHLDLIGKGDGVKYKFEHAVTDEKLMGKPFADDIKLEVSDVNGDGQRNLDVTVFTGDRQRPVQNYDGLTINPVFIWFLDKCVENFRLVSGGKQPYLKGRMRDAFIDKAEVEPASLEFGGKTVRRLQGHHRAFYNRSQQAQDAGLREFQIHLCAERGNSGILLRAQLGNLQLSSWDR